MSTSSRNRYAESQVVIPEQTHRVVTHQKSITTIQLTCFYILMLKYKFHAIDKYMIQETRNQVRFPLTEIAEDRIGSRSARSWRMILRGLYRYKYKVGLADYKMNAEMKLTS